MFISLQVLEQKEINFREQYPPEAIDLGAEMRQVGPLLSSGRATLIEEHHGHKGVIRDIRVVGELATRLGLACARCLEPVERDVTRQFELLYRPLGSDAGREEISVTQAEAEIGYYTGEGIELTDVLREQILLAVPLKVVCREQCRGLCPQCGKNLNQGECKCAAPAGDSRWEALKELKDKLER
ncbi:MAG: YceD family protein [Terriglobales bacterium]